jgi:hypothetical protein
MRRLRQFGGQHGELESAISYYQEAVEKGRAEHSDRFGDLGNLASALSIRFQQSGNPGDLETTVAACDFQHLSKVKL